MSAFDAFNEGVKLSMDGEHERAVRAFDEAVGLDPSHHGALAGKAFSLTQLGRAEEAIECFKAAIRIEPDTAEYFRQLGLTYLEIGDVQRAEISIRGAIEIDPSPPYRRIAATETYNFAGNIMIRAAHLRDAGQLAAEREHYGRALAAFSLAAELDPQLKEAEEAVTRVKHLMAVRG
jgi:tetratricopeptide (TPR) repeat protein